MISLPFGTLPTRSGLATLGDTQGVNPDSLMRLMRALLKRDGASEGLHQLLRAVGFTWGPAPTVTDLELDVAAVAEALAADVCTSLAPSSSDQQHGAAKSEASQHPASTTGDVAGGLW
jgi:hypothetical protein